MLKIPQKTEYVIDTLLKSGFEAYIVGGCVRDMLLGNTPHDFDVTTSAQPEEIMALFERTVPTGIKHGTVTVLTDSTPVEVTTFRTEGSYSDYRRPDEVKFVKSLEEDLARRDFTVNAMAYNHTAGLVDYFDGTEDLKNHTLRAVGEADKRFKEDALRILRLFRFSSILGFSIEEKTLNAALSEVKKLESISRERIASEISKAVLGDNLTALRHLTDNGGLKFIGIPHSPDYKALQNLPKNQMLRLFAFLKLSGADAIAVLNNLKESNQKKNYCNIMLSLEESPLPQTKPELKKILANTSTQILTDWLSFKKVLGYNIRLPKAFLEEVINNNEPYLVSHLKIDGNYIRSRGFSGKKTGEILENLRQAVLLDPQMNTNEKLIAEINKLKP